MRTASYEDPDGRLHLVQLPDGAPDSDASMGLPLGPPSLESLNLPLEIEVRLHNQLFHRSIFTYKEAQARRLDIFAAWQAALRVDTEAIVQAYNTTSDANVGGEGSTESKAEISAAGKGRAGKGRRGYGTR